MKVFSRYTCKLAVVHAYRVECHLELYHQPYDIHLSATIMLKAESRWTGSVGMKRKK